MGHKWAAFLQQPHIVHGNVGVGGLSATVRMVGAQSFVNIGTGGDVDRSRHLKVKRRGSNWNWRSELFFHIYRMLVTNGPYSYLFTLKLSL